MAIMDLGAQLSIISPDVEAAGLEMDFELPDLVGAQGTVSRPSQPLALCPR